MPRPQLVLLQAAINSSEQRQVGTTWFYTAISAGLALLAGALLLYAFWRGRQGKS